MLELCAWSFNVTANNMFFDLWRDEKLISSRYNPCAWFVLQHAISFSQSPSFNKQATRVWDTARSAKTMTPSPRGINNEAKALCDLTARMENGAYIANAYNATEIRPERLIRYPTDADEGVSGYLTPLRCVRTRYTCACVSVSLGSIRWVLTNNGQRVKEFTKTNPYCWHHITYAVYWRLMKRFVRMIDGCEIACNATIKWQRPKFRFSPYYASSATICVFHWF